MFDVAIMHMTCQVVIKKLLQGVDKIQENDSKGGYIQWREKKSPNINNSCPKMTSLENWLILKLLPKLPMNVGDLGKLIVTKGFKKLPKVQ